MVDFLSSRNEEILEKLRLLIELRFSSFLKKINETPCKLDLPKVSEDLTLVAKSRIDNYFLGGISTLFKIKNKKGFGRVVICWSKLNIDYINPDERVIVKIFFYEEGESNKLESSYKDYGTILMSTDIQHCSRRGALRFFWKDFKDRNKGKDNTISLEEKLCVRLEEKLNSRLKEELGVDFKGKPVLVNSKVPAVLTVISTGSLEKYSFYTVWSKDLVAKQKSDILLDEEFLDSFLEFENFDSFIGKLSVSEDWEILTDLSKVFFFEGLREVR